MPGQSGWHGFQRLVDFGKATLSLGTTVVAGVWLVLTVALDGRYAGKEVEASVAENGQIARAVQGQIADLKTTFLQEQIFEVRQEQCRAEGRSRSFYAERIGQLSRQYQEANGGTEPYIPACSDL